MKKKKNFTTNNVVMKTAIREMALSYKPNGLNEENKNILRQITKKHNKASNKYRWQLYTLAKKPFAIKAVA